MNTKDKPSREPRLFFHDTDRLKEDDAKAVDREKYHHEQTNITNYCEYFSSHVLLQEFPFSSFDREQQLCFIYRILECGTASMLTAATNEVNSTEAKEKHKLLLTEWDEDEIDHLLSVLQKESPADESQLQEIQAVISRGTDAFIKSVSCGNTLEKPFSALHLLTCRSVMLLSPSEIQIECLPFYTRHVENCIRFLILYWNAQTKKHPVSSSVSSDFPELVLLLCRLHTQSIYPMPVEDITHLDIISAFHHYAAYMKYIIPFIMEGNVEKAVFPLVETIFTKWKFNALSCFLTTRKDAIICGLRAIGIKPTAERTRKVQRLYERLKEDRTYFHDERDPVIWALLGFILFQCTKDKLPVIIKDKSLDLRNSDHSSGRKPYSIKTFADKLLSLQPGKKLENDMRIFYINQIIETGTTFFHRTYEDVYDVKNYLDLIINELRKLLLIYDSKNSVEILSQILLDTWHLFTHAIDSAAIIDAESSQP